jgi:hypothetical protein
MTTIVSVLLATGAGSHERGGLFWFEQPNLGTWFLYRQLHESPRGLIALLSYLLARQGARDLLTVARQLVRHGLDVNQLSAPANRAPASRKDATSSGSA